MKRTIIAIMLMSLPNLALAATCKGFAEKQAYVLAGASQNIGEISQAEVSTVLRNESQMDDHAQWQVVFNWSNGGDESSVVFEVETDGSSDNSCTLVSVKVLYAG